MAPQWMVQHAVFDSLDPVASFVHEVRKDVDFRRWNVAVAICRHGRPEMGPYIVMCPIIGWIAGNDPIEVARVTLCLDQRLLSTQRAAIEIRMRGLRTIKGLQDNLVSLSHQMDAA